MTLSDRIAALPHLGLGISAEFESYRSGIDTVSARADHPEFFEFLEYGGDLDRGLDAHIRQWADRGWPTTYHFLDVNLEELQDVDDAWLHETAAAAKSIGAAWLCGDGGLWHFGPRDRAQMTLLPPVLSRESAAEMAEAVARIQAETGMACLPENPPSTVFLGDLHLLDYFALVSEKAECPLVLDCAHLAVYQRLHGHEPTTALDSFPLDRVAEIHLAGGALRDTQGFEWVEDDHNPEPLKETWEIVDAVVAGAINLKAAVFECEKNPLSHVLPNFQRLREILTTGGGHAWRAR